MKQPSIEVYGDYWHQNDTINREEIYAKSGYKCLVLWEHEIQEYSDDTLALFLIDLLIGKINDKSGFYK